MKKITLVLIVTFFLQYCCYSQNIGIGNTDPKAKLDINGELILRSFNLVIPDGVIYSMDINTNKFSNYKLTGPAGNFAIAGITSAEHDRTITLFNRTGNSMEIYNEDVTATAGDRILTGTGSTFAVYNGGTVTLRYDTGSQHWEVISSHYNNLDYFASPALLPYETGSISLLSGFNFSAANEGILPAIKTVAGNTQIMGTGDDSYTANLPLPFPFIFDEKTYTNFSASCNGLIQLFTASNITPDLGFAYENKITSLNYNAKLAPLWDDLILRSIAGNLGGIWSVTTGNAPNREFHVEWIGNYTTEPGNNLRFRVILFETTNQLKFHYDQMVFPTIPGNGGFTLGITTDGIDFSNINPPNNNSPSSINIYDNNYSSPLPGQSYSWSPALSSYTYLPVTANLNLTGFIETEAVIAPALSGTWTNTGNGFKPAGYYMDKQKIVHLSGMVSNSSPAGKEIFKLPGNYIPAGGKILVLASNSGTGYATLTIDTNGSIICTSGSSGFISLDNISFRAN